MNPPPLSWRAALLHGSLRLAGHIPLRLLHACGALLGHVSWLLDGRLRKTVERNLSLAVTQQSAETRHALARQALVETGKAAFEVARIWGRGARRCLPLVREVRGEALLDEALARGKGMIVAAPHLGCWELLGYWLASRMPLAVLYRPPRQVWLEPLLVRVRGDLAAEQVRAEASGVRTLLRRLAGGGAIGILPDQKPRRGEGIDAPFFGVPASTMVLLPRLAQRTGATVLFAFAERLPRGAGYRVHILPAPDEIASQDTARACAALNRGVEACVRMAMPQYQWSYRRWPRDARPPA